MTFKSAIQDCLSKIREIRADLEPVELFADVLQDTLQKSGYSDKEIAHALNISTAALSQWKNSKRLPDVKTLSALATFLKLNPRREAALIGALAGHRIMVNLCSYAHRVEEELLTLKESPHFSAPEVYDWYQQRLDVLITLMRSQEQHNITLQKSAGPSDISEHYTKFLEEAEKRALSSFRWHIIRLDSR